MSCPRCDWLEERWHDALARRDDAQIFAEDLKAENVRLREALADLVEQFEPQTRPDHEILERARAALDKEKK